MTNLQHHYVYGVSPRTHANTKRTPKHGPSFEDNTNAVNFIKHFASVHAIPLPGCQCDNKDEKYLLLPSDMAKAFVHKRYIDACDKDKKKSFKRRKFETLE